MRFIGIVKDVLTFIDCCCLTPYEQFFSDIMARTSYIRWEDDDVCFAVDQHAKLDFYSAISLKQRYNWNTAESAVNQHIPNPNTLKQQSRTLEASMLTITQPMQNKFFY